MTPLTLSHPNDVFAHAWNAGHAWWHKPGTLASLVVHGTALAALGLLSQQVLPPVQKDSVIELVMAAPEELPKPPEPKAAEPVKLAPSRPAANAVRPSSEAPALAAAPRSDTVASAPVIEPIQPAHVPAPAPASTVPPKSRVIDNDGIPSDYVHQVYNRISRNTSYPRAARMAHEEARIAYRLTLSPQGALLKYEIQPSGSEALNDAAVNAIKAAAPFPSLPDLGGSAYLLSGVIEFKLVN